MKILYCNPIFLDYRLPFYRCLKDMFHGEFYVMYSTIRYKLRNGEHLLKQIPEVLGDNALPFNKEYLFNTYEMSFKKYNGEKGKRIPFTRGLLKAVRLVKPDVLITEGFYQWTPLLILYSLMYKIPLLMGYERTRYTERNTGCLKKMYRKLTDLFVSGYLVNGSETKLYLLSLGISEKKIFVTGMSADGTQLNARISSMQRKEKNELKATFSNGSLVYLFSGQLVERKGAEYLLNAWRKHIERNPDDALIMIGAGPLFGKIKKEFGDMKSVHLLGKIPYADVFRYYAISDVFILPTLEDNWSLVIPEAMSCGLPVATSIYNGCYPELVHRDENGCTFDSYKEDSIIEALEYFHHQDLKMMGMASRRLEETFNTENCAQREYQAILNFCPKA